MMIAWRMMDGKAGHEKQTLGLLRAMQRSRELRIVDVPAPRPLSSLWALITRQAPFAKGLPHPDIVVGAGHATHLAVLAAGRMTGARTVVLMRPSLPARLFDLAIVPEHDNLPPSKRVLVTRGALTAVPLPGNKDLARGIVLLGGPSAHYRWDDEKVAAQVRAHLAAHPTVRWTITGSRRTPPAALAMLEGCADSIHDAASTPAGWVEEQMLVSGHACVSPDSVSMVYEALTAGCLVSVLDLEPRSTSRVVKGLELLKSSGLVAPAGVAIPDRKAHRIDESARCAEAILDRWFTRERGSGPS